MNGTARIAWRGTSTEVSRLYRDIGFDDAVLDIRQLDVTASEGALTVEAASTSCWAAPGPALQFEGRIDLERTMSWLPCAAASGDLVVAGDVEADLGGT